MKSFLLIFWWAVRDCSKLSLLLVIRNVENFNFTIKLRKRNRLYFCSSFARKISISDVIGKPSRSYEKGFNVPSLSLRTVILLLMAEQIVNLNVGGHRFATSRQTLTWIPDTFFTRFVTNNLYILWRLFILIK